MGEIQFSSWNSEFALNLIFHDKYAQFARNFFFQKKLLNEQILVSQKKNAILNEIQFSSKNDQFWKKSYILRENAYFPIKFNVSWKECKFLEEIWFFRRSLLKIKNLFQEIILFSKSRIFSLKNELLFRHVSMYFNLESRPSTHDNDRGIVLRVK